MRRRLPVVLLLAFAAGAAGCRRHAATMDECGAVLARLVELELEESGYRDPVARARWVADGPRRFASDLARCPGLLVRDHLLACLRAARSSEAIVHDCGD